jgi:hypothetical protein
MDALEGVASHPHRLGLSGRLCSKCYLILPREYPARSWRFCSAHVGSLPPHRSRCSVVDEYPDWRNCDAAHSVAASTVFVERNDM